MKTLKLITIILLLQFAAFTSFGSVDRSNASLVSERDNALTLLEPREFASTAGTSSVEAELILKGVVANTINITESSSFSKISKRVEALLNAAHAANSSAKVNLYEHLAFLKGATYKAHLNRAIRSIGSKNDRKAKKIAQELNSVI